MSAYSSGLSELDAEEQLKTVTTVALGGGNVKKGESRRIMSRLQAVAGGGSSRRAAKASPEALAAMGIGFEEKQNG